MLRPAQPPSAVRQPLWLLRLSDQAVLGSLGILAVVALAVIWHLHGGAQGKLVEYDQLPPQAIQFQIEINSAPWTELCELPRVGPTLAQRIVAHRQEHGPFRRLEDLRHVRGIGPKTLESIRPYLAPLAESETAPAQD